MGVQAAAVCKRNNVINTHRKAGVGLQSHSSYTSQRSASLHVIYRESLINLVNRIHFYDTSKVVSGKNADFRSTKTWVQIVTGTLTSRVA